MVSIYGFQNTFFSAFNHVSHEARRQHIYPPICFAVETNSLVSSETELPYDYYSMPFCKPPEGVKKSTGTINPGTILLGVRIENSPYNFSMMVCAAAQRHLFYLVLVWSSLHRCAFACYVHMESL